MILQAATGHIRPDLKHMLDLRNEYGTAMLSVKHDAWDCTECEQAASRCCYGGRNVGDVPAHCVIAGLVHAYFGGDDRSAVWDSSGNLTDVFRYGGFLGMFL